MTPLTHPERQELLRDYFAGREKLYALWHPAEGLVEGGPEEVEVGPGGAMEVASLQARLAELWDRYQAGVPVVPLSRCPFTGVEVAHSLDTFGLDGLWWDYNSPIRPPETLPPTYFALAGAVKLGAALEEFPFLCRPGPEAPFVVPRLLELPGVKAVLSSVPVGGHVAYPVFYFADPLPGRVSRINTWGTAEFWFQDGEGTWVWDRVEDTPDDFDFDLERWIQAGRLLWIAPGDERLRLRSHVRACPYLGLEGRRQPLHITMGMVLGAAAPSIELPAEWEVVRNES